MLAQSSVIDLDPIQAGLEAPRGVGERPADPWRALGLTRPVAIEPAPVELPLRRTGLSALLAATARRHPTRVAFTDAGDKVAWSGRPAMSWTYGAAAEIVARLGRAIRTWRLPPGSRIGLWYPGGIEGFVAHLAVEAAGHVPCPLPPNWDEARLRAGIESAGISAVLTQGRLDAKRPAESLCRVAAGCFGLRYLAAFGPDVPDGVINLDALALERDGRDAPVETGGGLVSFAGGDPASPILRPGDALLAAIAVHLVANPIGPGERILSLLPGSDLRGLVTGLGAALIAGAALETLAVFDGARFTDALSHPVPTHLVAPAFLEAALTRLDPPETLRSITIVHRAPMRLTERLLRPASGRRVVDAVCLDEDVVISGARGASDLALLLADPDRASLPRGLVDLHQGEEPDALLSLRGQACKAAPLRRGESPDPCAASWRPSRFRATLFAGTATGLVEA